MTGSIAILGQTLIIVTGYIGYQFTAKQDLVIYLISIEVVFLGLGLLLVHIGYALDNQEGSYLTLILQPQAGGEAAQGLGQLLSYNRIENKIER